MDSFASQDQAMHDLLQLHLSVIKCRGLKMIWTDGVVAPGQQIQSTIEERLKHADVILLLVSIHYLTSLNDSSIELELARAVQRHNRGQARVIPILFRSCLWKDAPFSHLAMLPANGKAIGRGANKDHIYAEIAFAIKTAIEEWAEKH